MLNRNHIELGAKLFVVAHIIFFIYYTIQVMKMLGFLGGMN